MQFAFARPALIIAVVLSPPAAARDAGVLAPMTMSEVRKTLKPPRFKWDVPQPVLAEVQIPGVMEANGIPVKLHSVVVKGKFEDLARHMATAFVRQGLYVAPLEEQSQPMAERRITGFDYEAMISYTVIFQTSSEGTVSMVLGEANLGAVDGWKAGDIAPLFPGARSVMRTNVEGLRTMTYLVASPVQQVKAFYDAELPRAGYKPTGEGTFRRGNEELFFRARAEGGTTSVLVGLKVVPPEPGTIR